MYRMSMCGVSYTQHRQWSMLVLMAQAYLNQPVGNRLAYTTRPFCCVRGWRWCRKVKRVASIRGSLPAILHVASGSASRSDVDHDFTNLQLYRILMSS